MSGLEALAAFGLACNVMQAISFTKETVSICKTIYQSGSADPDLAQAVINLSKVAVDLNTSLRQAPKPLEDDQQALLDIATDTASSITALKNEVDKVSSKAVKGKYKASIMASLRMMIGQNNLEKLEKRMLIHQKALETQLLARIW